MSHVFVCNKYLYENYTVRFGYVDTGSVVVKFDTVVIGVNDVVLVGITVVMLSVVLLGLVCRICGVALYRFAVSEGSDAENNAVVVFPSVVIESVVFVSVPLKLLVGNVTDMFVSMKCEIVIEVFAVETGGMTVVLLNIVENLSIVELSAVVIITSVVVVSFKVVEYFVVEFAVAFGEIAGSIFLLVNFNGSVVIWRLACVDISSVVILSVIPVTLFVSFIAVVEVSAVVLSSVADMSCVGTEV